MDKIISFEHYSDTVNMAKEKGCKLSNCFFLPNNIRKMISEGKLYFQLIDNGLLLLDDQTDFYRCYYFLSEQEKYGIITLDKSVVIEFPFNNALNAKQLLQVEKIESMGFRLGRESGMMCAAPDKIVTMSVEYANDLCYLADQEDASQILDLMHLCFNPLYSFLPTMKELSVSIQENRVLVVRDGEKIVASLISGLDKKMHLSNK